LTIAIAFEKKNRFFTPIWIGLELPKEKLKENITYRVDQMLEEGLVDECRPLIQYIDYPALKTVGYSETFQYLEGKISLYELRNQIILHTSQYAKRQMTWFRKNKEIQWFDPEDQTGIRKYIFQKINNPIL
jgi:tRNA dimethylallyltransferase